MFYYKSFNNYTYISNFPFCLNRADLSILNIFQKQPPEVFYKNGVLKNFVKFTGKFANFLRTPF